MPPLAEPSDLSIFVCGTVIKLPVVCYAVVKHTEQVFKEGMVMCTEPGCASVPKEDGEPYTGLVKPGT